MYLNFGLNPNPVGRVKNCNLGLFTKAVGRVKNSEAQVQILHQEKIHRNQSTW